MARCKFCSGEITWMKEGGRNKPINGDGGIHSCDEMKKELNLCAKVKNDRRLLSVPDCNFKYMDGR